MTEYATIRVQRYRDPQGQPTCRNREGLCDFIQLVGFGTEQRCIVLGERLRYPQIDAHTVPLSGCPVWADQEPA